jgi:polysaccharide chain length determinant protein (PEP-CTERM system associated)
VETPIAEIMRYVKLVIEKKYLFIISSLIIMSMIVWGSYFIPNKYEAKSTIFIESNVIEQLVKGIAISPSMDARIQVLRDTMLGRSLVLNVIRKLDLDSEIEDEESLEEMIIGFQDKTGLRVKKNNLINVGFTSKDPLLARDYVNTLVEAYVDSNIFAKREEAYDASKFLQKQVDFFKEKMDRGEEAIIKFRQDQGIYAVMDERALIAEIKNHEIAIENLKIKRNELNATMGSVKRQLKDEEPFMVTMFSTNGLDDIIQSLENRRNQLLVNYTENYPEVIKLKAEIETLRNKDKSQPVENSMTQTQSEISAVNPVHQELKQKSMELEAEIEALNSKEKLLNSLIAEKKQELRNIPENKKQLADLIKENDSFKKLYQDLLERLGQSEVSKQMEIEDKATTFRIIEPAILPTLPVSPNRKMMIIAGIVIGILGGFALIFILDYVDDSVKTIDILKSFGLPVLAIIPTIQNAETLAMRRKKDLVLYSVTGLYMLCIFMVFAMEILGLPYMENFINNVVISNIQNIHG